jgi:hypothetical protein
MGLGFLTEMEREVSLESLHVSVDSLEEFGETRQRDAETGLKSDDRRLSGTLELNSEELG